MIYDIEHEPNLDNSNLRGRITRTKLLHQQSIKSFIDISTVLQLQECLCRECRICLQSDDSQQNPLVTPCKCTGSVKYVHRNCYIKWIQRQFLSKQKKEQLKIIQDGIQCQICKENISLELKEIYSCTSQVKFQQKFGKNRCLFFLFFFFLVTNISCLLYLSVYVSQSTDTFQAYLINMIMIIACFLFLLVTLVITGYYFITDFFLSKAWKLVSFGLRITSTSYKRRNRLQIHPISVQSLPQ